MTPTLFRPEAEADLDEAQHLTTRIESSPLEFPIVYRDARRTLLRRFPYAFFFRTTEEKTLIVAVADLRRDPSRWLRRL